MLKKRRFIIAAFLILLIGVAALVYFGQWHSKNQELYYSGTIEANASNLSFQVGGRVAEAYVRDGETVQKNQLLAQLDTAELEARRDQAKANLERFLRAEKQAETNLQIYQRTLPQEVARAEAAVEALKAQVTELKAGARTQEIESARQAYLSAQAVMEDAKKNRDRYAGLFNKGTVSQKEYESVALKYETALRQYQRTKEAYDLAREGARKETIEAAEARLREGQALLKQTQSGLTRIEVARQDAQAAGAQVQASRAALNQAEIQLQYSQLRAPFDGVILSRNVEPGEVVSPGREVFTLADLREVDLKIFVGETEIGKVKPGQRVDVKIDTFPDKTYEGRVSFISQEGEFTPKIIQTRKERVKLVYLVKVSIPNPNHELKPGMPADAWLR